MRALFLSLLLCCGTALAAADRAEMSQIVASLPVQHQGRIKPLASVARAWLLTVHARPSLRLPDDRRSATQWLMELLCDQENAFSCPVFTERNPAVIQALGLEDNPHSAYSFNQLAGACNQQASFLTALHERDAATLDVTERELLRLFSVIKSYHALSQSLTALLPVLDPGAAVRAELALEPGPYSFYQLRQRSDALATALATARTSSATPNPLLTQIVTLGSHMRELEQHGGHELALFPPQSNTGPWVTPWRLEQSPDVNPRLILAWQRLTQAWIQHDQAALSAAVTSIQHEIAPHADLTRLTLEVSYLQASWYAWAKLCYILALVAVGLGLLTTRSWPLRLATTLTVLALLVHLTGIGMRIWILQRPPVTTLYESILFVAAVAVIGGLIWEALRRDGLATFVAALLATTLLFVADAYADDGDTMGMLQAVLNSRMWLTIHVLTIATGYSIALIAGVIGHCYLGAAIVWPQDRQRLTSIERAMHGIGLVALLLVLAGTILGGIWADQSWGRFWGWDPKENGAMWIVLWLLMLFHMRLSGQAPALAYAAGMVVLNAVVVLAWFGVNLLGIGLHSYGFTDSVVATLLGFVTAEIVLAVALWALAHKRARPRIQPQVAAAETL
ncbi:MAG: cytochrome c biogenesis protein CcsA [Planctomycetota bacterium]|jgi:ABC-type transport system involved in cytochrome c biogenesis permease subunit|nr:cytochrome c biogenesis protein CcsA [Planctomycetota bacterium]